MNTDRIIRLTEVIALTGLSASTIARQERAGTFPARVALSANAVGWRQLAVFEWIRSRQNRPPKGAGVS